MANSASKFMEKNLFDGFRSGGRACSEFKRNLRYQGLSSKQLTLFKSVKELPAMDEYDDRIDALKGLVKEYSDKVIAKAALSNKDRVNNASHCATLESLMKLKDDGRKMLEAMTDREN